MSGGRPGVMLCRLSNPTASNPYRGVNGFDSER